MKFGLKNDDSIELHLTYNERELLYKALLFYSAYGKDEDYVIEQMEKICTIMNVLLLPEYEAEV